MTEMVHTRESGQDKKSDLNAEDEKSQQLALNIPAPSPAWIFFFLMRTQFPTENSFQHPTEQRKTARGAAHGILKGQAVPLFL